MHFTVYRLLGLRYLLHRWDRAALIVVSIALGVATLVSSRILNRCIESAAQETTTPGAAADLYVTNGEAGVYRSLATLVRNGGVPGVKSVQPIVADRVTLPDLDGRIAVLLGTEVSSQLFFSRENDLKVKVTWSGEGPTFLLAPLFAAIQAGDFDKAGELWNRIPGRLIVVSRAIFDDWKARGGGSGKPFVIRYATRDTQCLPVGIVDFEPGSPLASLGKNFVGMEVGQAARVLRPGPPPATFALTGAAGESAWDAHHPQRVNRLDVFLEPGSDRDAVQRELKKVVGGRADVRTPDMQRRSTQEIVSGLQLGFLVCAAGAMVVGLFLVYNAMAVTVAERRADIGILRSLGATRSQIIFLFSTAAAFLGVVGSVLGVPLGVLLAEITLGQFKAELESMFLNPDVDPTRVTTGSAAVAIVAGTLTAVFAALVPALQAAAADPAHVVRRTMKGATGVWRLIHRGACVTLVGGGLLMILFRNDLPARLGSVGGMMIALVGLLLSAPILVGMLVSLLQPLVRAVCGIELRLAFDNLTRAPGRTGVVIGALGAGVALMFQTAGVGRSNEEPVVAWIQQVVQADHFVFAGNMTSANSSNSPMASEIPRAMAELPSVERVMSIRYSRPEFNGTVVYLIGIDAEAYCKATRARVPSGMPDLERFLELPGTDDILVSENFARRHKVTVGETITIPGANGRVQLRVIGTVRDYSWSRGTIFMDRARYAQRFGDELVDITHVFLKPGATPEELEAFTSKRGLFVTDKDSLRKFISELINRVYLLAYIQQLVVGVVAALGVVTALLISVLQRKRELGLLLAVGATPRQVLRSVMAEALLMGLFGTVLGILIGIPMEVYVVKVVLVEESGFLLDVILPWKQALGIGAAAMLTAAIAGLIPAIHAIRTRIPEAIQYE
jgi:putative ABC transport system permease protein